VFVACSTQCFARYPLDRALRIIGELEFSKVDVAIAESSSHLKPSEVAADIALAAQRIRIGPSLTPAAFTVDIDAADAADYDLQLLARCRLARMSNVSVLAFKASKAGSALDAEVERLGRQVRLVEAQGLVFTLITHVGTLTETPAGALELCKRIPGLGLTLDPTHYIYGPHQGGSFDELYPFVRHVHLRDSGRAPGKYQVRIGQGEVEYGRIITMLERHRYDRLLTVAIHDLPDAPFVMESEVRKLKFLLESLV
jgi:sugar phosphate isomerase/epimerase